MDYRFGLYWNKIIGMLLPAQMQIQFFITYIYCLSIMKQIIFFASLCCVTALLAACEQQQPQQQNYFIRTPDNTMGTVELCIDGGDCTYGYGYDDSSCGGSYSEGTILIMRAIANEGFRFVKWDDENTDNPRTITVTCSENSLNTYTAIFDYIITGTENGHEYVDLGLPSGLKWATCNVGATIPQDFGNYYAWGETQPNKDYYDWSTYKWATIDKDRKLDKLIKYCTNDSKTVLDLEDDAAAVNWGGTWRMPTPEDWKELINNCTWTWTGDFDKRYLEIKGPNGNRIILPDAGFYEYSVYYSNCKYWLNTIDDFYMANANCIVMEYFSIGMAACDRMCGLPVRPVCE